MSGWKPWGQYGYIVCSYITGLALCLAPWTRFWETNYFLDLLDLRMSPLAGWIRGAISGVGAVNLLFALQSIYSIPGKRDRTAGSTPGGGEA